MIYKIFRILQFVQIIATTAVGFLLFDIKGMLVGFVIGVMIAGHFLVLLGTRQVNAENTKMLKELLAETQKLQQVLNQNLPQTAPPPKS
jgi:hypothetical protein